MPPTPTHAGRHIPRGVQPRARILAAVMFALACLAAPAHGDDYTTGLQALELGNAALTVELWRPLAERGDVDAQFGLGVMYNDGLGVEQDHVEANYWFLRAADQDHAPSQFNLGNAYKNGTGMTPAPAMAVHWWRKAAAQDFGPAQFNLGSALLEGSGVPQDRAAALDWYRRAAANGHPQARTYVDEISDALWRRTPGSGATPAAPQGATAKNIAGKTAKLRHGRDDAQASAPTTTNAAMPLPMTLAAAQPSPVTCSAWLDRDAHAFTVQLLSSRAAGDVSAYAQRHALNDTATCSYLIDGRRWHALLFGRFPSAATARAALAALPSPVRADGAYVRRIAEVRTAVARSTPP